MTILKKNTIKIFLNPKPKSQLKKKKKAKKKSQPKVSDFWGVVKKKIKEYFVDIFHLDSEVLFVGLV